MEENTQKVLNSYIAERNKLRDRIRNMRSDVTRARALSFYYAKKLKASAGFESVELRTQAAEADGNLARLLEKRAALHERVRPLSEKIKSHRVAAYNEDNRQARRKRKAEADRIFLDSLPRTADGAIDHMALSLDDSNRAYDIMMRYAKAQEEREHQAMMHPPTVQQPHEVTTTTPSHHTTAQSSAIDQPADTAPAPAPAPAPSWEDAYDKFIEELSRQSAGKPTI